MNRIKHILVGYSVVFLLIHIWAAFYPSHYNWGFHFFAFYDPIFSLSILVILFLIFIPGIQKNILNILDKLLNIINVFPNWILLIFIFSGAILLFNIFSAKLHLLGDGALLLRDVSDTNLGEPLPATFNRQLLTGLILQLIKNISQSGPLISVETIFKLVDFISGIIFITSIFLLIKNFILPIKEKVLLGLYLFFCAGSQFFFGYIENYALLFAVTSLYLTSSWWTLENKINIIFPIAAFGLMVGLHIGSIIFLPSLLVLIGYNWKYQKFGTIVIFVVTIIISSIFLYSNINNIDKIVTRIFDESQWNFLPLFKANQYFAYTVFSLSHFLDWTNSNILIAPFGIILIIAFLIFGNDKIDWRNKTFVFLMTATLCGIIFTLITFFALGMARDWDFMASYFLPLMFLNVYLLYKYRTSFANKAIVPIVVLLSFLHWASWIGVNSDENRHLARIKLLDSSYFLGHVPRLNYYENLGSFFWSKNSFPEAKNYFEKYVEIDPNNPRILGNISVIYSKLNQNEKALWALQKAAETNTSNPGVYINLGTEYQRNGNLEKAQEMYHKALELDSTRVTGFANLGAVYMQRKDYKQAIQYYLKALHYGLNNPILYREIASSYFFIGDYENSLKYLDEYLLQVPDDQHIHSIRNKIQNKILNRKPK